MIGLQVDEKKEMACKIEIRDGLPPHRDGTPQRVCSGVSKTRGGKQQQWCSFLQLLVYTEWPQSKQEKFKTFFFACKKYKKQTAAESSLPAFLSFSVHWP